MESYATCPFMLGFFHLACFQASSMLERGTSKVILVSVMDWMSLALSLGKPSCWRPNCQDDSIRKWGLWEIIRFSCHDGRDPMMGLGALLEEAEDEELPLSTRWGYSEKEAICKPGRGPLPGNESAGILILDFSASKTKRKECLLFKPSRLSYFGIVVWAD